MKFNKLFRRTLLLALAVSGTSLFAADPVDPVPHDIITVAARN